MNHPILFKFLVISNAEQAMGYLVDLNNAGLLYHLDDDPADCLSHHCLTDAQLSAIEHNVAQLFTVDWSATNYDCPFGFIVDGLYAG